MDIITIEEARAAYARNGLKPAYGHTSVINGACCVLGALCDGKAVNSTEAGRILRGKGKDILPHTFGNGFDDAFRGQPSCMVDTTLTISAYSNGYDIGKGLRENPL